jgi:hypothetical protein
MLSDAGPVTMSQANTPRTSYALEGHEKEFGTHTGHRVEVVGTLAPPRSARGGNNAASAAGIRRLQVESVKMVAQSCAASKP